jgi:hypothetical protein
VETLILLAQMQRDDVVLINAEGGHFRALEERFHIA